MGEKTKETLKLQFDKQLRLESHEGKQAVSEIDGGSIASFWVASLAGANR